jgi:acetyltransferase
MTTAAEVAGAIIPIIRASGKPVVVALMGEDLIVHAARLLRQARVPDYRFPERAALAMGVLWRRAVMLEAASSEPVVPDRIDRAEAARLLAAAARGETGLVDSASASDVARAYGLSSPRLILAAGEDRAVAASAELGYPLAMKIASPDISHKSDGGGVRLNLGSGDDVARAFQEVMAVMRTAHPEARLDGVHLQSMVPTGQEVILGVVRDDQFGPLVMFGAGGVEVESLRDIAFALAPLSRQEAETLVDSTQAGRRLRGGRGLLPADRAAVVEAVLRLAQLALDQADIAEIEVNPLRVFAPGEGATALDVRVRLDG